MATGEKAVVVVGVDGSAHGYDALVWTLRHFSPPAGDAFAFKLLAVHAKPSAASVVGYSDLGGAHVFSIMESNLQKMAELVVERTKELCHEYKVCDVHVEVVEGDARHILCDAVQRHHAIVLVLGSHGFGAFKRALLGSVSDYCAHNANCSVLIVKNPKQEA